MMPERQWSYSIDGFASTEGGEQQESRELSANASRFEEEQEHGNYELTPPHFPTPLVTHQRPQPSPVYSQSTIKPEATRKTRRNEYSESTLETTFMSGSSAGSWGAERLSRTPSTNASSSHSPASNPAFNYASGAAERLPRTPSTNASSHSAASNPTFNCYTQSLAAVTRPSSETDLDQHFAEHPFFTRSASSSPRSSASAKDFESQFVVSSSESEGEERQSRSLPDVSSRNAYLSDEMLGQYDTGSEDDEEEVDAFIEYITQRGPDGRGTIVKKTSVRRKKKKKKSKEKHRSSSEHQKSKRKKSSTSKKRPSGEHRTRRSKSGERHNVYHSHGESGMENSNAQKSPSKSPSRSPRQSRSRSTSHDRHASSKDSTMRASERHDKSRTTRTSKSSHRHRSGTTSTSRSPKGARQHRPKQSGSEQLATMTMHSNGSSQRQMVEAAMARAKSLATDTVVTPLDQIQNEDYLRHSPPVLEVTLTPAYSPSNERESWAWDRPSARSMATSGALSSGKSTTISGKTAAERFQELGPPIVDSQPSKSFVPAPKKMTWVPHEIDVEKGKHSMHGKFRSKDEKEDKNEDSTLWQTKDGSKYTSSSLPRGLWGYSWFKITLVALGLCILAVGIALGVVLTGDDDKGASSGVSDEAKRTACAMPNNVLSQCKEAGYLTPPSCAMEQYDSLLETFVPEALNDATPFKAPSCAVENIAMWNLATITSMEDDLSSPSLQSSLMDHYALSVLYFSTNGPNWLKSEGWWTGLNACKESWIGISCNDEGRVAKIELAENGMEGTLPSELSLLSQLATLKLDSNILKGSLPEAITRLSQLQILSAVGNELVGSLPDSIRKMTSLVTLSLAINRMTGTIPAGIGELTLLQEFNAQQCKFSGAIPTQLGRLKALQLLDLSSNSFASSPLPSELGLLGSLEELLLEGNSLVGQIPSQYGLLSSLRKLDLSNNAFKSTIPTQLSRLFRLKQLRLQSSQVLGSIPTFFGSLVSLEELDLAFNDLQGALPSELGKLPLKRLNIQGNQIVGSVPAQVCALRSNELLFFTADFACSDNTETKLFCPMDPSCCGCSS